MPFDATDFPEPRQHANPPRMSNNEASTIIIVLFAILMLTPISMAALVDIVRVIAGR